MSLKNWETDTVRQEIDLHKTLRIRNLDKITERKSEEIVAILDSGTLQNAAHHFNKYLWQLERYAYIHRQRRTGDMFLKEMSEAFSVYYFAEILRQGCLLHSHQNINQQHYDFSFFEAILEWIETKNLEKTLAIAVYFHSYLSMTQPEKSEYFFELKRLLTQQWQCFPQEEMRDLYLIAINYCIKRRNKGEAKFVREGFGLYKTGIDNGILLENGFLSVYTYKNVHLLADKLGEFDWIIHFLEKYKHFLPADQRENHYNFNIAQYFFRRKKYNEAMPLLQTIEFSDVLHNLDARRMLLIMYYDLGEYDAMESLMESFKSYLNRQKELGYHKESFSNLLKFSKKLLLLPSMSKMEKDIFKKEVTDCNVLAEKSWLLAQI